MPLLPRKSLLVIVLLLSSALGLWSAHSMAQKKSSAPGNKPASAAESQPIAIHEFQVEGVDVALMDVTRTAPDVVIVKWEYRNKTAQPQQLATGSKGWSDPYRLSINTYLLAEDTKIKIPVSRDDKRVPVAAQHGAPNQLTITVPASKTLKTWAKYIVPTTAKKVTVVITGTEPFEAVDVKEPEQKPGS
ncbi:MAG TPA: hypothetical protein VJW20_12045 [Candidatus Angelobacter sp.]|nr:hypothetical protein [Candidatus Angelobacter sp.]